ncbi:hypothetical protein Lal_00025499 [Lupinus albus]|nr:hypothetical protein Lal_00025499 [Lupinus albus]
MDQSSFKNTGIEIYLQLDLEASSFFNFSGKWEQYKIGLVTSSFFMLRDYENDLRVVYYLLNNVV